MPNKYWQGGGKKDYIMSMSRASNFMTYVPGNGGTLPAKPDMDARERAAFTASIKQGLAELDAGQYVSGAEMEAWAKSLFTKNELPLPPVRQRARS
jgi:hypothetical protein